MDATMPRFLFWAPRVLGIVFGLFLSIFAADVFEHSAGFWETSLALFMHLIPVFVVFLVLALAWRHELFGTFAFFFLGGLYLVVAAGRFHGSAAALISGPLFLIGVLFLLNWRFKRRLAAADPPASGAR